MPVAPMRGQISGVIPAGTYVPLHGVESLFEYNGLLMNDRRWVDQIRITRVGGLDDSDVRDSREANADDDGETSFGGRYGGRTISLTGYVQAGNLEYLRYLWQQFKAATDDLSEHDLILRWYDWYDTYIGDDSNAVLQDYIQDRGGTLTAANGEITSSSTATVSYWATARQYKDVEVTLHSRSGSTLSGFETGAGLARIDGNNFLFGMLNGTLLQIYKRDGGTITALGSSAAVAGMAINSECWVRFRKEGNVLTAKAYVTAAQYAADTPAATATHTLVTGDAAKFGPVVGYAGVGHWTPIGTLGNSKQFALDIRALNPGDMVVPGCQKFAKVESEEFFDGYNYRKPFMLTLRSSSPIIQSRMENSISGAVAAASYTFPGGGSGIPFPVTGGIVFGAQLGTITNLGFARTYARTRITGPVTNATVVNLTNGRRVVVTGTIASGDYVDIDSRQRTVVDSTGASRYDLLGAENDWLLIEPGANLIVTGADAIGGSAILSWNHAYR